MVAERIAPLSTSSSISRDAYALFSPYVRYRLHRGVFPELVYADAIAFVKGEGARWDVEGVQEVLQAEHMWAQIKSQVELPLQAKKTYALLRSSPLQKPLVEEPGTMHPRRLSDQLLLAEVLKLLSADCLLSLFLQSLPAYLPRQIQQNGWNSSTFMIRTLVAKDRWKLR